MVLKRLQLIFKMAILVIASVGFTYPAYGMINTQNEGKVDAE